MCSPWFADSVDQPGMPVANEESHNLKIPPKYVKILVVTGILGASRIIPFSKWLITMVIISPLGSFRVIPLPNGLSMVYKWQITNHPQIRLGWSSKSGGFCIQPLVPNLSFQKMTCDCDILAGFVALEPGRNQWTWKAAKNLRTLGIMIHKPPSLP